MSMNDTLPMKGPLPLELSQYVGCIVTATATAIPADATVLNNSNTAVITTADAADR
jgi:hypothetical protein